jgi:L-cysteine desulfidase
MNKDLIIDILRQEVVPALGCTEPVAVALCAASAYKAVKGRAEKITVRVSSNIYKNGMSVGIPGVSNVGLNFAAALGVAGGNPSLKLKVLSEVKEEDIRQCYQFISTEIVTVSIDEAEKDFFISCDVETSNGKGTCHIRHNHSNVVYIALNDVPIFKTMETKETPSSLSSKLKKYKLIDILTEIKKMNFKDIDFMLEGSEMNMEMARVGLETNLGMSVGKNMKLLIEEGILSNDLYNNVVMLTASASDARMSGCFMPVMSSAGSGNHGLTAIIPVAVTADKLNKSKDELARALGIAHITTIYIKQYTGKLSAICGCGVAAATGASVAICYLLGGWEKEFKNAIANMVGDIAGMICDGAKAGCAIKLSTAAGSALKSALLAVHNSFVPSDNGIVGTTIEETIQNLGRVSAEAMVHADKVILDIMIGKNVVSVKC